MSSTKAQEWESWHPSIRVKIGKEKNTSHPTAVIVVATVCVLKRCELLCTNSWFTMIVNQKTRDHRLERTAVINYK